MSYDHKMTLGRIRALYGTIAVMIPHLMDWLIESGELNRDRAKISTSSGSISHALIYGQTTIGKASATQWTLTRSTILRYLGVAERRLEDDQPVQLDLPDVTLAPGQKIRIRSGGQLITIIVEGAP
jgi:hypothetical protein